jgi:hypothetical protein
LKVGNCWLFQEYYGNTTWKQEELTRWVTENIHQVSLWLSPTGTKSTALAPYMKQGPVLLFFTPRNFYTETSDAYEMVSGPHFVQKFTKTHLFFQIRQVGMEYFNCQGDAWVTEMARDYLVQQRTDNFNQLKQLRTECASLWATKPNEVADKKCRANKSVSVTFASVLNASKHANDGKSSNLMDYCEIGPKYSSEMYGCECGGGTPDSMTKVLKDNGHCSPKSRPLKKKLVYEDRIFDGEEPAFKTSMLTPEFDNRAPENIKRINLRRKCEMLQQADAADLMFYGNEDPANLRPITGIACKQNRTLSLMAIDSVQYHVFAERLGVDVLRRPNKTVAFILDHENESTYLLDQQPITLNGLVNFVHGFARGTLARYLRTTSTDYKHTHYFNLGDFRQYHNEVYETRRPEAVPNHIFLRELSSKNFEKFVLRSNKVRHWPIHNSNENLIDFLSDCDCALSLRSMCLLFVVVQQFDDGGPHPGGFAPGNRILSHRRRQERPAMAIHDGSVSVAHHFSGWIVSGAIQRFFGYVGLICLVFFVRKSESRIYPTSLQVTVPNVLGFVLANLDRPTRLYGIMLACLYSQKISTQQDCTDLLLREIGDAIAFSLREWRNEPTQRRRILRRLRLLKTLFLHLLQQQHHSCDFKLLQSDVRAIFKIWSHRSR